MPVRHTDFVFVEETYATDDYPSEIRPTLDSDRFPIIPPKPRADRDTLSKPALLLRDRLAETSNANPEDVPDGLLRAFEAADAWPDQNVRYFAAGRVRSISTEAGEILYVDMVANPLALAHDPNNGRTIADARAMGYRYLESVRDDQVLTAPVIEVTDAAEFVTTAEETSLSLGFSSTVRPGKDLQDLNWIGLQGVHEPALVVPMLIVDAVGNSSWMLITADGNRRLAMGRRVLREATNLTAGDTETWSDHLRRPDGTLWLRDITAADVVAARRKALFKDIAGGSWHPKSGAPAEVERWLESATMSQRSVARTRILPIRLVVGYRNVRKSEGEPSGSMEVIHRYVRRLHIAAAAPKEWTPSGQAVQVGVDAIRKMKSRSTTVKGYRMPLTLAELDVVYEAKPMAWAGADSSAPDHPLRLGAKVLANFVCNDHTAIGDVKQSLVAHSMSVHSSKLRENRAEVAAAIAMPVLGFTSPGMADYNRARTAVDRLSRHPMFALVDKHPGTKSWWEHLSTPVGELLDLTNKELAQLPNRPGDDMPDEKSIGPYGPASRALLFLATLAQATNPAFAPRPGETASPWQLTLNGLGGTRGITLTTPELVIRQVIREKKEAGAEQLAEIVLAGLESRIPKNLLNPDYAGNDSRGHLDEKTRGTVTEEFLRSAAMGWDDRGKAKTPAVDPFVRSLDLLQASIEEAVSHLTPFQDTGPGADRNSIAERFRTSGLPQAYTKALLKAVERIRKFLERGAFIAETRAEIAGAQHSSNNPEGQS